MMSATYYDFSIPWNLTFNYSISYSNQLARKNIVQTLSYSGSVNLTPKWGITLTGGFDFETGKLTTGRLHPHARPALLADEFFVGTDRGA